MQTSRTMDFQVRRLAILHESTDLEVHRTTGQATRRSW